MILKGLVTLSIWSNHILKILSESYVLYKNIWKNGENSLYIFFYYSETVGLPHVFSWVGAPFTPLYDLR